MLWFMFTKNSYSHRRFKLLTQSCISVQYSARPRGIILFSEGQRQQRLHNGFKTFQKSHIQKFQKYFFKLFSLTYTYMYSYYNVQLASIKNISWNYENMVSTSKQIQSTWFRKIFYDGYKSFFHRIFGNSLPICKLCRSTKWLRLELNLKLSPFMRQLRSKAIWIWCNVFLKG